MGCSAGKILDSSLKDYPSFEDIVSYNEQSDSAGKNLYPRVKSMPCLEKEDSQNQLSRSSTSVRLVVNEKGPVATHFHTKAKFKSGAIAGSNEASRVCSTWENEDLRATFEDLLSKEGLRYSSPEANSP